MASKTYQFSGVAKWAKIRQDQLDTEYNNWTIDVFLTPDSLADYVQSGSQWEIKEADLDGSLKQFVRFKRNGTEPDWDSEVIGAQKTAKPADVYLRDTQTGDYNLWPSGAIGNGSTVTCTVEVYRAKKGLGSRLLRIFVDDLVEYKAAPKVAPETAKLPF